MQIEAGKYYKTRDGRKVGPMIYDPYKLDHSYCWRTDRDNAGRYNDSGEDGNALGPNEPSDLVSEWIDSPVREVTRREIVPGTYGKVKVTQGLCVNCNWMRTAEELREAAHILNQIAEVLEDV